MVCLVALTAVAVFVFVMVVAIVFVVVHAVSFELIRKRTHNGLTPFYCDLNYTKVKGYKSRFIFHTFFSHHKHHVSKEKSQQKYNV